MTNEELQEAYEREEASARIRRANIEWVIVRATVEDLFSDELFDIICGIAK